MNARCQHCTPQEATDLREHFTPLMESFNTAEDLANARLQLCEQWDNFWNILQSALTKLRNVQHMLDTRQDLTQAELNTAASDLLDVQASLQTWHAQCDQLDSLMERARLLIRDRQSRRGLRFASELQQLLAQCDRTTAQLEGKQGHLNTLQALWDEFTTRKDELLKDIHTIEEHVAQCSAADSTLPGLRKYIDNLKSEQTNLTALAPRYEQVRNLGRRLMTEDTSRMAEAQEGFTAVELAQDTVQADLSERLSLAQTLATQWQQYSDCRESVARVLRDAQPVIDENMAFAEQDKVRDSLDNHKVIKKFFYHIFTSHVPC